MDENGEWRRLHNEEHVVRVIKCKRLGWAGYVASMEESRYALKILTGKRPLGKPRNSCEHNIRMDLKGKCGIRATGLNRLRIGIIGDPL